MRRWLRTAIPRAENLLLVGLAVVAVSELIRLSPGLAEEPAAKALRVQGVILAAGCLAYGYARAHLTHPAANPAYYRWLSTTPWTPGRRMPFGVPVLTWQDLPILAAVEAFWVWRTGLPWPIPLICVLIGFMFCLSQVFWAGGLRAAQVVLLATVGVQILFLPHWEAMLGAAACSYGLYLYFDRRGMQPFLRAENVP